MRFVLRMAVIDAIASRHRFAFVVLAIAAGVAALTGVRGFSESVRYTLHKEARTLMAADVMVRLNQVPSPQEREFLKGLHASGVDHTLVTETVSMAGVDGAAGAAPVLTSIKAVDLSKYPFYGFVEFDPVVPVLSAEHVIASDDLLLRLGVAVGDTLRIGSANFKISGVSKKEPDRMTTGFTLGPRVLLSREGFDRSGLNTVGSRATQRVLLRLPEGMALAPFRQTLTATFGRRARIIDYTEANPTLARNLDRATAFLSMVSLIALIVGGVGVATSIESHIRQRIDHLAIMKCIGGRSSRLIQIYAVQAVLLGLVGSAIGVVVGFAAQAVFPSFLSGYFDVDVELVVSAVPALQGTLVGVLTALLFTIPPLLMISKIRPSAIFRRDFEDHATGPTNPNAWIVSAVIGGGIWAIAMWMSGSIRIGSYFTAGLIVSLLILALLARTLLAGLRRVTVRFGDAISPVVRQALSNLYRPGAHVMAVLVALGVGVMFTLSVHLLQEALLRQLQRSAPPNSPNVFLINVMDRERESVWEILRKQEGVLEVPDPSPAVAGQLSAINGVPVEQLELAEPEQRYFRTQFALTWSETLPRSTTILEGQWWAETSRENLVSVEEGVAEALKLNVGDQLEWSVTGRPLTARIASVRRTDAVRLGANNQFIFTRASLESFSVIYSGAVRVLPAAVGRLQRSIFERHPTVTVVNAADILEIVQSVVDRITLTVRFLSGFAIAGGLIILASSIAGTRFRRMREAAILKTLGARRSKIIVVFSLEFLVIGLFAGIVGGTLALAFSGVIVTRVMDAPFTPGLTSVILAAGLCAAMAVVTGWAASFRVLGQKPLEVLRVAE